MGYEFDPELAGMVDLLGAGADGRAIGSIEDVQAARAGLDAMLATLAGDLDTSGLTIQDVHVPGPEGAPDVLVRTYAPDEPTGAGLLHLHGGGFVLGSVDSEHVGVAALARDLGAVVVSVDYRLAPEHPFPAGVEDCYAALAWFHAHAGELGVDPARIGVFGQSAGGGLAAAVALLARDRGGPPLCFQYLGIPELDDRLDTASMRAFDDTPLWNRPNAVLSWRYYLHGDAGAPAVEGADADVSPYAAPARATDLAGLPPAYISTMEFDPLRDEGIRYALGLLAAGVSCELHSFPGTFHGSALVTTAAVSKRANAEMAEVLKRRLA